MEICPMKNKTTYFRSILVAALLIGFDCTVSVAQVASKESDLSAFLQAESGDASKLLNAYLSPVIKGLSYGATSGWYHTGQVHKKLGIDLGVTAVAVSMPSSENTFDPTQLGLSANTIPSGKVASTILGPETTTSYTMKYTNGGQTISTNVNGPPGLDLKKNIGTSIVPAAMIQLGIGTIKNTDLKVRYMPEFSNGDSRISMLGFGLMHDIKQYLPGVKELPFDLSVLVGYNSISGATNLTNTDVSNDGKPYSPDGAINYKFNSWVAQAIISKKISVLTAYAGVGFGSVSTDASISGSFTLDPYGTNITLKDPFSTTYKNSSVKLTLGMRLKFGPVYLNSDYTLQEYNALAVGFGFSIR